MTRTDIIQRFIDERHYKSYLEIGVFRKDNNLYGVEHDLCIND